MYFPLGEKKQHNRGLKHNTDIGLGDAGLFITKRTWRGSVITVKQLRGPWIFF